MVGVMVDSGVLHYSRRTIPSTDLFETRIFRHCLHVGVRGTLTKPKIEH